MLKNRKLLVIVAVAVCLAVAAGYKLHLQKQQAQAFTGTVEVTKADITPKVSGYLDKIMVKEGDDVAKGSLLAVIDDRDYVLQLERDKAQLAQAQSVLDDLERGARSEELQQAAANADAARSVYMKSAADWQRYQDLFQRGAVSRQQYDDAKSSYKVALKQLDAANASYALLANGTREDQIAAQRNEVKRSAAVAELSANNVAYTRLKSPVDGVVLTKNYEPGEYINAGAAVLTIADLSDSWVKIYVPSALLGKITYGQTAKVKIDAYPERSFAGRIKEIASEAEYTPRQSISPRERANMVFAVKVELDNTDKIFKPGMIADVILDE